MRKKAALILWSILILVANGLAEPPPSNVIKTDVVIILVEQQYDVVQPGGKSAFALHFELKKDWHFYASSKTAPGGMNLKLKPAAQEDKDYIIFSESVFPESTQYFDKALGKKLEVFSNKFTVFIPFSIAPILLESNEPFDIPIKIDIEGAVCSGTECRMPDFGRLSTAVKIIPFPDAGAKPRFVLPDFTKPAPTMEQSARYSVSFALLLAFLAGLALNIMPCVWPVLPIIVMRIVEQAKQSKSRSVIMGLAFCFGILLFFMSLAGANIILRQFYDTQLQWGDQFRNPSIVIAMAILLVALALFTFGVFTIGVPSVIAGKSGSGKGYPAAVGMGFLAAVLSTPCSFGILAAAFAWAQSQTLPLGTVAIMVIGVGMALPYAILTSMPGVLNRLPKPGRWMEIFKQSIGFVLLVIAVKLVSALPHERIINVLYFAAVLGFCIWMWGGWVSYNTKVLRKWLTRTTAVALAVAAGSFFLPAPPDSLIDWKKYDADLIKKAEAEEKPILIKFTADWCLSCQVVEKAVYSRKDIAELIEQKDVLAIKADTTLKTNPATIALKNIYSEPGVPVNMLFVPGQKKPAKWHGMFFADELKKVLEKLPSPK